MLNQKNNKVGFDSFLIGIYLSLVAIGWLMIYAATYDPLQPLAFLDIGTEIGKQSAWTLVALVAFVVCLTIEWNFWNTFAFPIYGVSLLLLLLVLIFGTEIKGARSWFSLGPGSFQPSEITKFGTALAMASYLSFNKSNFRDRKSIIFSIAIFIAPILLILLQPDPGSALVFFSFLILLYRKGLSSIYYVLGFSLMLIFIFSIMLGSTMVLYLVLFVTFAILLLSYQFSLKTTGLLVAVFALAWLLNGEGFTFVFWLIPLLGTLAMSAIHFTKNNLRLISILLPTAVLSIALSFGTDWAFNNILEKHQQERINVWLRPELCDPRGSLYNLIQSKMAIGSGGFQGKGFLEGEMTKLRYVPEQSTDFIFSTVGEEQGFIGSFGVIILFTLLITRIIVIGERSRLEFIKNYAYAAAGIIFVHFFVNIGMTIGLMPVIGIPLPFLSKGGSSLLAFTILVGVLVKMDVARGARL